MKKTTLALSALALNLGLALSLLSVTAAETPPATTAQQMPSPAPMLEKVIPSAVSTNVEDSTTVNTSRMPRNFQQFFGDDSPFCQGGSPLQSSSFCQEGQGSNSGDRQRKFMAPSSGVIIDADKDHVVANNHVVDNAMMIKVQLSNDCKSNAKMVDKDSRPDITLVQIRNPKNLTAIKMADSDTLRVGDYTIAIGNPFGLGGMVTSGIVSALGRSGLSAENYENFIRTDATINRDDSGGALTNLSGELIGISTAILVPDGGNIGIGFAIPSSMAKGLTSQMVEYGQVKHDELSIMGTELNSKLAKTMKVDAQRGAFVSQVLPNSSTAKAGIKAGDVVASLNGKPISSFAALRAQVGTMLVGSRLTLGLLRDGKQVSVNPELQQSSQNQVDSSSIFNGIEGAEMSNRDKDQGVVVNNVKTDTPAAQIGLKKGGMIIGADRQAVKNIAELRKVLDNKPSMLTLNIQRGNSTIYLLIQ